MTVGPIPVSIHGLVTLGAVLFYMPAVVFARCWLMPRLSPIARRLAYCMLIAQVTVILAALFYQPTSNFDLWIFQLHKEGNIPSTLASVQLALIAVAALLTGRSARATSRVYRLYCVATGLVFLLLAVDEFAMLHELHLGHYFIFVGVVLVAATIAVALHSPRRLLLWHTTLLIGLAIAVVGAYALEETRPVCGAWSIFLLDDCLYFFYWEECLEFLGIWLVLVAVLGHYSEAKVAPSRVSTFLLYLSPVLWVLVLALLALAPRLEARLFSKPTSVHYERGVRLSGYRLDWSKEFLDVRLYIAAKQERYENLGFSIHLVDQASGSSIAMRNEFGDRRLGFWLFGPDDEPIFIKYLNVPIPHDAPFNRALWAVLSLWRERDGDFVRQEILSSELPLLDNTQVTLGELVIPAESLPATGAPLASFKSGFVLESVNMPERIQAGQTLDITFAWRALRDGEEDHAQFLHFFHQDSGKWWVYDQAPLGARLPTRLWYAGLADSETWRVPLPDDLAPGRYKVFTGLYRVSDKERVAAIDAEGAPWLDHRVELGTLVNE